LKKNLPRNVHVKREQKQPSHGEETKTVDNPNDVLAVDLPKGGQLAFRVGDGRADHGDSFREKKKSSPGERR
jgi:hypothetical protein